MQLDKMELFASVNYAPHEGQLQVHRSRASRRVLACGVRWGKSTLAVHEGLAALLAPGPPSQGWFVTPSRATTALLIEPLFDLLEQHFPHRVLELDRRSQRAIVRNVAGECAQVHGRSADRPEKLLGASLSWVILDEAARLRPEIWREFLAQRLVDRDGWALFCSTPHGTGNWFHELYERGQRSERGFESWSAPTWANPAISSEVIETARSRLDVRTFYTEFGGEFVGPLGRTCPTCSSPRELQQEYVILLEGQELGACVDCGRPLDTKGEPVGTVNEDGTVAVAVIRLVQHVPPPDPRYEGGACRVLSA